MIEILLEEILNKIHQKNFSDPKQISEELGRLIIRDSLSQEQFAYCSSKIFNSELNLFSFLNVNCMEKDKHIVNLRKEVLEIVCDYLIVAQNYLINYLGYIRNSALMVFKQDISQVVREAALKIVLKIVQNYEPQILEPVVQVEVLAQMLLDEIKLLKPTPSIKGKIWQILGELIRIFPDKMHRFVLEIQEVSFYSLKGMMENSQKVEIKTIRGLLQLTRCVLEAADYPEDESSLCSPSEEPLHLRDRRQPAHRRRQHLRRTLSSRRSYRSRSTSSKPTGSSSAGTPSARSETSSSGCWSSSRAATAK